MVAFVSSFVRPQEYDDDQTTASGYPAFALPHELRPFYAAVNRVHELEATPDASPAEIASAQRAVAVAAAELTRLVDAMQLFEAKRATVRYFGRA